MPATPAVLIRQPVRPLTPSRIVFHAVPVLVVAGFRVLLMPYRHRVLVQADDPSYRPDVEVDDVVRVGGVELAGVRRRWPRIALMWDDSPRSRYRAEVLGASVLVPIDVRPADLVATIERVHRGGVTVPPARWGDADPAGALSPRETGILSRICDGRSNVEIAGEMFLSINTVKTYIRTAYQKMGVSTRSQAVLWGLDHGY